MALSKEKLVQKNYNVIVTEKGVPIKIWNKHVKVEEQAIQQKQVAEQSAEKAKNTLVQAQTEAQIAAAEAKGKADARRAEAEGEAAAILVQSQAKAKAQELQRASLTPELLELRRIEMWEKNWDGSVPQYVGAGSGFLMQMPAPSKKTKAEKDGDN